MPSWSRLRPERTPRSCSRLSLPGCTSSSRSRCASRWRTPTRSSRRETGAGRVVQVGTMKRYDPAVEQMLAELPDSAAELLYVSVVVNDPEFEPYFGAGEIVRGSDVPADLIDATRRARPPRSRQPSAPAHPDVVRAFSESFLGSLIHDLNVVHGLLERMGEPLPAEVIGRRLVERRPGGRRIGPSRERRPLGQRVDPAARHARVRGVDLALLRRLGANAHLPVAVAAPAPDGLPPRRGRRRHRTASVSTSYEEAFSRELVHFHGCILGGTCRTPPEQAAARHRRPDRMFLAAG